MGSTRVETPIEQTELYHFAEGVFVDAEKFDGELAENQDVVLVSATGQLPKCYYLPEADWGEAPLVPGRNPLYEGINLAQALYAGIHNAAGDIAKAIGQLPLQDMLIPQSATMDSRTHSHQSGSFGSICNSD